MFNLTDKKPETDPKEKGELNDLKKKRDEYNLEIRKQKREEMLIKKRNRNTELDQKLQDGTIGNTHNLANDETLKKSIDEWLRKTYDLSELYQLVSAINSDDRAQQHYGIIGLRKVLSNEQGPPIQPIIDANLVPKLIQFMNNDQEPHLQLEAAWALTNIASGTTQQTQSIIDKGGIPAFISLLKCQRIEVAEQAIWAIGNIAGDSYIFRDMILNWNGLDPLLNIVNTTTNKAIIKHGTWAISNLCRGKPLPDLELVAKATPTMAAVLLRETDIDVLTDAAWALSYLSRTEATVEGVVATGVVPSLVHYLDNPYLSILIPCLRTLGNIVTGTEIQTNLVLQEPNFLPKLFKLFEHKKKTVRRETCWVISNITAGNHNQIGCILANENYFKTLVFIASNDIPEIQKEASWALSNATKNSNPQQIDLMIQFGLLECFVGLMSNKDPKTVEVVLEGVHNILNWGAIYAHDNSLPENPFLVELDNKGGVAKIEELQTHPNNQVYLKALRILENHFELDSVL